MKGILFSDPMVRAVLQGRKTQTRQLIRPQPPNGSVLRDIPTTNRWYAAWKRTIDEFTTEYIPLGSDQQFYWKCPYALGEIVYVKEAWSALIYNSFHHRLEDIVYRADRQHERIKWKSSLHLSEANSRIKLRIVEVRGERLWDISEADALAEGLDQETCAEIFDKVADGIGDLQDKHLGRLAQIGFAGAWAKNLAVFAYTFERVQP